MLEYSHKTPAWVVNVCMVMKFDSSPFRLPWLFYKGASVYSR